MPLFPRALGADIGAVSKRLLRSPGSSLAVVTLLALGSSGVAGVFLPLRAAVLGRLPFPDPDRLVALNTRFFDFTRSSFPNRGALGAVFSAVAAHKSMRVTLSTGGEPVRLSVAAVTSEFFATMGAPPLRGRDLASSRPDSLEAVVGYDVWRTRVGEAPDLSRCTVMLDGTLLQVVGVAPRGFDFPDGTQVWIPSQAGVGEMVRN